MSDISAGLEMPPDDQEEVAPPEPTSNVVCTIVANPDGSFRLYAGDEPEDGGTDGGEGEPEETPPQSGEGATEGQEASQEQDGSYSPVGGEVGETKDDGGTDYTSLGELLKGVHDVISAHHESSDGMSDQEHFDAGAMGEGKLPMASGR